MPATGFAKLFGVNRTLDDGAIETDGVTVVVNDGSIVGSNDGLDDVLNDGKALGTKLDTIVGQRVGNTEGVAELGAIVGATDGLSVDGVIVGLIVGTMQ